MLQCMLNVYKFLARFKVVSAWRQYGAGTEQPGKSFVGVISDTRPRSCSSARVAGAERIIHAGDIGRPAVLTALAAIRACGCGAW